MKMDKLIKGFALGLIALFIAGCDDGGDTTLENSITEHPYYARFDPASGVIPFPNNLLFAGTSDGTLNIPVADPTDYSDPKVAMNELYGFSTIAPITAQMSAPLDPASVVAGKTVRLFEVETASLAGPVTSVTTELVPGQDYLATVSSLDSNTLVILPLKPLGSYTTYLVTLDKGLKTSSGPHFGTELYYALAKSVQPLVIDGISQFAALTDAQAVALEPLRGLTNATEIAVESYTISDDTTDAIRDEPRDKIILSWSFTTQPIGVTLMNMAAAVTPQPLTEASTGHDTPLGAATIHVGTLQVPYYLGIPSQSDPTAPLTAFWHDNDHNGLPDVTGTETIPVLLTIPKGTMPTTGWPVAIFQHGITADRSNLLGIADTLANAGIAGIAIDMPLHGITNPGNPLYAPNIERTFGLDLDQDNNIDPSGSYFINLRRLLTTRDNLRQALSDLLTLHASLGSVANIDASRVYYVGHSLGGVVGVPFMALDGQFGASVLGMPGGGIAKLLDGSATFGPQIAAGLAAAGVVKGTPEYESFMGAAQTIIDTVDPLNYATLASQQHATLLFEVVGGNSSPPDQGMPNNVWEDAPVGTVPSPTAGTDPLAQQMGLIQHTRSQSGTSDLEVWVKFNAGHHSSLLTPKDALGNDDPLSLEVYLEMQAEVAGFLASEGYEWQFTDTNVIDFSTALAVPPL